MKQIFLLFGLFIFTNSLSQSENISFADNAIMPYSENPFYWQYKGKPVLLIGGTDDDNLFQIENLESHLDSLKNAGGNFIRNTMSDRDSGNKRAFYKNPDGKYDLTKWNELYWKNFENLLFLANERDIIIQIEIWDRFDHSRNEWLSDPYNPNNNINYTAEQVKMGHSYPVHPGSNTQPFFYSVPKLNNNELLLKFQKSFVNKILSISLQYGNILYCIDNETRGAEEWAIYWSEYIQQKAGNKKINSTEMWDDWNVKSEMHKRTINNPDRYSFIDISQNSQTTGHANWENAQYVFNYISDNPRPVNSTKIYGSDSKGSWAARGIDEKHAINTFFRNLIGGFASSRFHRPVHGLGISKASINCMKTVRKIERIVKFWEIEARMDLLSENKIGESYIAAKEGKYYVIYFTGNGSIKLDLSNQKGRFTLKWINISEAEWFGQEEIKAGSKIDIHAQTENGSIAVIETRKGLKKQKVQARK